MTTLEQINDRLRLAQRRIQHELAELAHDLGGDLEVEVSVDWLSIATHDNPRRRYPSIDVTARVIPGGR